MTELRNEFPSFDELLELAKTNPEALEVYRQKQIEKVISEAPEENQHRLRGLQFQIDAQRKIHSDSPMGATIAISKMMHESFAGLREHLNHITGLQDPLANAQPQQEETAPKSQETATIVPFKKDLT